MQHRHGARTRTGNEGFFPSKVATLTLLWCQMLPPIHPPWKSKETAHGHIVLLLSPTLLIEEQEANISWAHSVFTMTFF